MWRTLPPKRQLTFDELHCNSVFKCPVALMYHVFHTIYFSLHIQNEKQHYYTGRLKNLQSKVHT
jgi:hypothetical protein